jgi:hypothetical protein
MPTTFIRVLSRMLNTLSPVLSNSNTFDNINFNVSSRSTWGNVKMRVALVLDNTGSMGQSGKITALRNTVAGTGGLIDQLSALSKNNGDVCISGRVQLIAATHSANFRQSLCPRLDTAWD